MLSTGKDVAHGTYLLKLPANECFFRGTPDADVGGGAIVGGEDRYWFCGFVDLLLCFMSWFVLTSLLVRSSSSLLWPSRDAVAKFARLRLRLDYSFDSPPA